MNRTTLSAAPQYIRPDESNLAAALAKEMGWKVERYPSGKVKCFRDLNNTYWAVETDNYDVTGTKAWEPDYDHNCSQLAVQLCMELNKLKPLWENLIEVMLVDNCKMGTFGIWLTATPAQKSFAAHKTLWTYNHLQENQ